MSLPKNIFQNFFGGEDFKSIDELKAHLKRFKIKQSDYFEEYFPRKDLLTGEKITYKDIDQYFTSDFLNKNNLKKYIKNFPDKGLEWSKNYLFNRKADKQLIYSPSQTELRSLFCPSVPYFESNGGYNKICEELGYKTRYKYDVELVYNKLNNPTIIIDNREQKELRLSCATEHGTLKVGDYGLKDSTDNIFVERKSLNDMVSTLSSGYERFQREIERAIQLDSYIVIMVEEDINSALSFDYLPYMRHAKAKPSFIFKRLRELLTKYPNNLQCLFVDGRIDASKILLSIFALGAQVKNLDLQYYWEKGELK